MTMQYQSEYLDKPIVAGRVWDLFLPETQQAQPIAFFFVHGGGWRNGSRTGFHAILESLADRGYICATTDYRLEGVNIAQQLADVRHSYARFVAQVQSRNPSARVVVFGSSAGAHLALLLSLTLPGACGDVVADDVAALDWQAVRPVGVAVQAAPVTFEPWEDIFPGIWQSMQVAAGAPYEQKPELYTRYSPMTYVGPDSPAVFLMEAQYEHMFPPQLAQAFAQKMKSFGRHAQIKTYPGTEHGFIYDLTRWQQREAIEDLIQFATRIANTSGTATVTHKND